MSAVRDVGAYSPVIEEVEPAVAGSARSLARLLRSLGATVLLAAASTFLLQRWGLAADVGRYWGLLGLTGLLAAAGFYVGIGMRESKSARTFLTLAAATIPAHFAILGGILYSQFAVDPALQPAAGYAVWRATSPGQAIFCALGATLVLAPIAWVSFATLARSRARSAAVLFLGLHALLWIPIREPLVMAILVATSLALLGAYELRWLRRARGLRTFEGLLVRVLLVSAPAMIAARSLLHYDFTWLMVSVLGAVVGLTLTALSCERNLAPRFAASLEAGALLPFGVACVAWALGLGDLTSMPDAAWMLCFAAPFAAILFSFSFLSEFRRKGYQQLSIWFALAVCLCDLALFGGSLAALSTLAVGIVALGFGTVRNEWGLLAAGSVAVLVSLGVQLAAAIQQFAWSGWGGLAALGILVIVCAALIERHFERLSRLGSQLRARISGWEY